MATAHAAISSMLRHAIPPAPQNFAVWFDYHAGSNDTIRRVIDTYLSNGRPITEEVMQEIHARFFDVRRESSALMETSRRLREAAGQVLGLVMEAGGHSDRYGSALRTFSGHVSAGGGDLPEALGAILASTEEMMRRSAELGIRLEASARVIEDLQARLQAALREARTDVLTGLLNRRAIEDLAAAAPAGAARAAVLTLAVFDIDRFKAINDTWGHPVGDAVLRRVATTLRDGAPPGVECGRFGGEEFALLLFGHDLAAGVALADRLRAAISTQNFAVRATGRELGAVTVSAGLAMRQPGEPWDRLVVRADAALYRAKQEGRNRVAADGDGLAA